ncbi:MAG: hypothetical protein JXB60_09745 [Candidatus Cloacimonetes bacterium]|nr:hypothetical protein [Candidatus Cloacimonadota bacterium]
MKNILMVLLLIITGNSCTRKIVQMSYPEKFEGLTQLVLASETKNVTFTEEVTKRILGIFPSTATVQVNSNVTFDYYLDFEKDGYQITFEEEEKVMHFTAPPIRVKKPVINSSSVSYPDRAILVNEEKEAIKILEHLTDRFIEEGKKSLEQPHIREKCQEKLQQYLLGLCQELGYLKVETVDINFYGSSR